MVWIQKTKWGHAKSQIIAGQKYDSKFEAGEALELEVMKRTGKILGFQAHVPIPLIVNGYEVGKYYIDFLIKHNDGTTEFRETKGLPSPVWALKWKILCAMYEDNPVYKLTVVMQGKYRRPKIRRPK